MADPEPPEVVDNDVSEALGRLGGNHLLLTVDANGDGHIDYVVPPEVAAQWLDYFAMVCRKRAGIERPGSTPDRRPPVVKRDRRRRRRGRGADT